MGWAGHDEGSSQVGGSLKALLWCAAHVDALVLWVTAEKLIIYALLHAHFCGLLIINFIYRTLFKK